MERKIKLNELQPGVLTWKHARFVARGSRAALVMDNVTCDVTKGMSEVEDLEKSRKATTARARIEKWNGGMKERWATFMGRGNHPVLWQTVVNLGGVKVQSEKTQLSPDAVFLAEENHHVSGGAGGTVPGDVPQTCTVTGVCGRGMLAVAVMCCLARVRTPTSNTASGLLTCLLSIDSWPWQLATS